MSKNTFKSEVIKSNFASVGKVLFLYDKILFNTFQRAFPCKPIQFENKKPFLAKRDFFYVFCIYEK